MHEVLVWGIGASYDRLRNFIDNTQVKINALISSYDEYIKSLDGIDVIKPEEIKNYNYEFIIVASQYFNEIVKIGMGGGEKISRDKFIPARVFELNGFDFNRYISVKNKNISIVSDDCWGGVLYHSLGLEFNTPFINFAVGHDSYFNLISNIEYNLKLPLELKESEYGLIKGYLGSNIEINFNHDFSKNDIMSKWNRRLERFNFQNYFVKMTINNDKEAYKFESLDVKNKIGFYYKDFNLDSIIVIKNWENIKVRYDNLWGFWTLIQNCVKINGFNRYFDILKILNGEKGFTRDIVYR